MSDHLESLDPRAELAELTSATLALMEWYAGTGASGVPVEGNADALLALLAQGPSLSGAARPAQRPAASAAPLPMAALPPAGLPAAALPAMQPPAARPAQPAMHRSAGAAPAAAFASAGFSTATPLPRAPAPAVAPPPAPAPAPAPRASVTTVTTEPLSEGASSDERRTRLAMLAEEARSCTKCVLHVERKQAVFARGNPFSEICFVGEGPGADEDAKGEPFVGAAGQLLDKMILAMGYRRDDVYICNVVKCRPPNNRKPEPPEMAACSPFLTAQLELIQPRVIVALGGTAMQGLTGAQEGITRLRGKWKLYKGATPIMPTFHPAYLLRTPAAKREVWADLQEVMRHLGKPLGAKG